MKRIWTDAARVFWALLPLVAGIALMCVVVSLLAGTSLIQTPTGRLSAVSFGLAAFSAVLVGTDRGLTRWEAYRLGRSEPDGEPG